MPSWILVPKPLRNPRIKLFCVPYAGRGASLFHPWASRLPETVELSAIQLPGRETRRSEPPFRHLDAIVEALAAEILPRLDRPYVLFGHSMGALICFELARALRRRVAPLPAALVLSGRRAPSIPNGDPLLHRLPDQQFVEELCRRYNGIPQAVLDEPELMRILLPALRCDVSALETYLFRHEPPLAIPFLLYGGRDDVQMAPESVAAWRMLTEAGLELRLFPGGHFYLQEDRKALLEALSADLARLVAGAPPHQHRD